MNDTTDLTQYIPAWQQDGRGLGATPPPDNPPLPPAYGQFQPINEPDAAANVAAPPPVPPPPSLPGGGVKTATMRAVVVISGTPTASTLTVDVPAS